jgi:hypothetical protein
MSGSSRSAPLIVPDRRDEAAFPAVDASITNTDSTKQGSSPSMLNTATVATCSSSISISSSVGGDNNYDDNDDNDIECSSRAFPWENTTPTLNTFATDTTTTVTSTYPTPSSTNASNANTTTTPPLRIGEKEKVFPDKALPEKVLPRYMQNREKESALFGTDTDRSHSYCE